MDGENLKVSNVINKKLMDKLVNYDGYQVFKNIRGSPAAWQAMQLDCLAKIRQYGSYTFFLTFSVVEFRSTEIIKIIAQQYGTTLTNEDIFNMNYETKSSWLKRSASY